MHSLSSHCFIQKWSRLGSHPLSSHSPTCRNTSSRKWTSEQVADIPSESRASPGMSESQGAHFWPSIQTGAEPGFLQLRELMQRAHFLYPQQAAELLGSPGGAWLGNSTWLSVVCGRGSCGVSLGKHISLGIALSWSFSSFASFFFFFKTKRM